MIRICVDVLTEFRTNCPFLAFGQFVMKMMKRKTSRDYMISHDLIQPVGQS